MCLKHNERKQQERWSFYGSEESSRKDRRKKDNTKIRTEIRAEINAEICPAENNRCPPHQFLSPCKSTSQARGSRTEAAE